MSQEGTGLHGIAVSHNDAVKVVSALKDFVAEGFEVLFKGFVCPNSWRRISVSEVVKIIDGVDDAVQ